MNVQPEIKRTGCDDPEFQMLISHLDHELWNELHEDQATYDQFNQVKGIQTAVIAYIDKNPVAIGCFKEFEKDTVEIKRMFVAKAFRGRGLSKDVLNELEEWALELGYHCAVLETSVHFKVAQNLYSASGYEVIENYDQYKGLTESICMKKDLKYHSLPVEKRFEIREVKGFSPFYERRDIEYFAFEEDFVQKSVRCIPMIVRFKMDKAGIKLTLKEWNKFSEKERIELAKKPCDSLEEVKNYYGYLAGLVKNHTRGHVTDLEVDLQPAWENSYIVPIVIAERMNELGLLISVQQWETLTKLQRFALMKLSRPGHESKNFVKAVSEFGLIPGDQKIESDPLSR